MARTGSNRMESIPIQSNRMQIEDCFISFIFPGESCTVQSNRISMWNNKMKQSPILIVIILWSCALQGCKTKSGPEYYSVSNGFVVQLYYYENLLGNITQTDTIALNNKTVSHRIILWTGLCFAAVVLSIRLDSIRFYFI